MRRNWITSGFWDAPSTFKTPNLLLPQKNAQTNKPIIFPTIPTSKRKKYPIVTTRAIRRYTIVPLFLPHNVLLCRAATTAKGNDALSPASARTICYKLFEKPTKYASVRAKPEPNSKTQNQKLISIHSSTVDSFVFLLKKMPASFPQAILTHFADKY